MSVSTSRTLHVPAQGPIRLTLQVPTGQVTVTPADVPAVEVTLTTLAQPESASARAIDQAALTADNDQVTLHVPTDQVDNVRIRGRKVRREAPSWMRGIFPSHSWAWIVEEGTRPTPNVVTDDGQVGWIAGGTVRSMTTCDDGSFVLHLGQAGVSADVRIPHGSDVHMATGSASLTVTGQVRSIDFTSTSGDLRAESCETLRAESMSGAVSAQTACDAIVRTVSGGIRLGRTGHAEIGTTSGDVHIGELAGDAAITAVSGNILIHATQGGTITAASVSGDVTVTADSKLAATTPESQLNVKASSISGSVSIP